MVNRIFHLILHHSQAKLHKERSDINHSQKTKTMNYFKLLTISLFAICCSSIYAQSENEIITELQRNVNGQGTIKIYADPKINALVGQTTGTNSNSNTNGEPTIVKMQGYRIQVFSGNDAKTAKGEAFQKEQTIKSSFPSLRTSVTYTAPFWKLRIGDFRTREEAEAMMKQISQQLPSLGREMYIVSEEVRVQEL